MDREGTCPICFEELNDIQTASPDVCEHIFCLTCLQKWAKQGSFCPVDRKRFKKIIDRNTFTAIQIKPRKRKKQKVLYDVTTYCEVCRKFNSGDTLLLCDCCDLAYHCLCLKPPLKSIPPGVWNCPVCVAVTEKLRLKKGLTKEVEMIVTEHMNWSSHSSDTSTSEETENIEHANRFYETNYYNNRKTINITSTKISYHGSSTSDSNNSSKIKRKYTKRKISNSTISLRERNRKKTSGECSSSSSDGKVLNFSVETEKENDTSSKTVQFNESAENKHLRTTSNNNSMFNSQTKWKALRPRATNTKSIYVEDTQESTSPSEEVWFDEDSSNIKKFKKSPLIVSETNNSEPLNLTNYPSILETSYASKKAIPEATVTSASTSWQSLDNEFEDADICLIESATSLKNRNDYQSKPMDIEHGTTGTSLTQVSSLKANEEICISDDDSQITEFNANDNKISIVNVNDIKKHKDRPVFSVFKKIDDETSSQETYQNINKFVDESNSEISCSKASYPIHPEFPSKSTYSSKYENEEAVAHALSKTMMKMERQKWKTYHRRSSRNRKVPRKLCCDSHAKYSPSNTIYIGKDFHRKNYADNFNKFAAVAKQLWNKSQFGISDTIILRSRRKSPSCTNISPCIRKCDVKSKHNKEAIPFETKKMLKMKGVESDLFSAVICLEDIQKLGVRKDGTLFHNWKASKS